MLSYWPMGHIHPQAFQATACISGYPSKLAGKIPLIKTTYTWGTENGEVKLVHIWKPYSHCLAITVLEWAIQNTGGEKQSYRNVMIITATWFLTKSQRIHWWEDRFFFKKWCCGNSVSTLRSLKLSLSLSLHIKCINKFQMHQTMA